MSTNNISFNWKIAGQAGQGVMVASKIVAKICKRHGLKAFNYLEYPSLIKGGHQTGQVFAGDNSASCQKKTLDLLVTLNTNGFTQHKHEITKDTIIIYNSDSSELTEEFIKNHQSKIIQIPFFSISKELTGKTMAANMVALGTSAYLLGFKLKIIEKTLRDEFHDKGEEIIKQDLLAVDKGFEIAQEKQKKRLFEIKPTIDNQILLTGNESIGLGAIAAGIQFYSAYPMTPATGLLHYLASQQNNHPLVVKHAEDEIGAINHAIGASFVGVRSMTGTSGGGFALMTETVSLAGIAEIPIVILDAQRKGPATGLPTWTEQADLDFILTAGHGDFVRVVLTPGSVEEHFELSKKAFYLAEKYHIPVFLLSDKFILESHQTMPKPDEFQTSNQESFATNLPEDNSYRRYKITDNGISPRSIPGQPYGHQLTNSYEHDEFGFAIEDIKPTLAQADKRARKITQLLTEIPKPTVIGPKKADLTFVSWGSTINVLKQLISQQNDFNLPLTINAIHIPCLWPFPAKEFEQLINDSQQTVMIEGNQSGQAQKLIRQETGITFDQNIRRYDGRPFYVEDLVEWIKK